MTHSILHSRLWYLEQLGITRYSLRHATLLQGDVALTLSAQIKLLIFSDEPILLSQSPLADICYAFNLTEENILCLQLNQFDLLPEKADALLWFVNCAVLPQLAENTPYIATPAFSELLQSAEIKKTIWSTFCHYEHYLTP